MASNYVNLAGSAAVTWKDGVDTSSNLPTVGNAIGDARVAQDTSLIYVWSGSAWVNTTGNTPLTVGTFDSQAPVANGAVITGGALDLQSADATHPGMVNTGAQTIAGQKTFSTGVTGTLTGAASLNILTSARGNLTAAGADGIAVTGGTNATIGAASIAQHVADTTHSGYLSSTDWNTFNGKFGNAGSARNVYVGNEYATVQLAVTHAESLVGSAFGDLSGVTVWVPAGNFNETVTINKNVNIVGAGSGGNNSNSHGATTITQVEVRPSASNAQPDSVRIIGCYVKTLVVDNQTAPASGVYNTSQTFLESSLQVEGAAIGSFAITNVGTVGFTNTTLTGDGVDPEYTATNFDTITFYGCRMSGTDFNINMDSTLAHVLDYTLPSGTVFFIDSFSQAAFNFTTGATSDWNSTLESYSSLIFSIDIGALSGLGFRDSVCFSNTFDPAALIGAFSSLQAYTPATPADWAVQPTNIDDGLDKLASAKLNATGLQVFASTGTTGGAATEAVTVTGLLSTDTILSVSQKTKGANNLPLLGWSTQINDGITIIYSANMGANAVVLVAVKR